MLTTAPSLPHPLARREHEVLHVLDHLEAQADHGPVDQPSMTLSISVRAIR